MEICRFEDASSFLTSVEGLLVGHEAENCLLLGIASSLVARPSDEKPMLVAVMDGEAPVAAAIRTPPRDLILSYGMPSDAVEVIVDYVGESSPDLPGVLGDKEPTDRFATVWSDRQSVRPELFRAERIHRAARVIPPVGVEGQARESAAEERDILEAWFPAFGRDVDEEPDASAVKEMLEIYLSGQPYHVFLWLLGDRPVSMAALGGPTPNGARVNAVYTPAEFRNRGYASAVTAVATQHALDEGRRFCFLFTDLANPTSNKIYRRIGYEPVCDVSHYRFDG
ncbi:MAG: GNAT family N-acetyltransferase [Actinomycetota bacterium]